MGAKRGAGLEVRRRHPHADGESYSVPTISTAPPGASVTILTKRDSFREIHYFYPTD